MNALAVDAKTRICIYGSKSVVQKLNVFQQKGAMTDSHDGRIAIIDLVRAMRQDLIGKTQSVSASEIEEILFKKG